jgi:hypothetical protein
MLTLPRSTAIAFLSLTAAGETMDTTPPTAVFARAQEFEVRAWEAFFKGLIDYYGRDAVRQKLAAQPSMLGRQFNPVLNRLWDSRAIERRPKDDPERVDWENSMWGYKETRATEPEGDAFFIPGDIWNTPPLVERKRTRKKL